MTSTPVSSRGPAGGGDEPLVHRPHVAERERRVEAPQRRAQAGDDGGGVRAAAHDRHRPERELPLRVVDDRLGAAADRRLLDVGDDADDAERDQPGEVPAERADLLRGGDDPLAEGVFAGKRPPRERLVDDHGGLAGQRVGVQEERPWTSRARIVSK